MNLPRYGLRAGLRIRTTRQTDLRTVAKIIKYCYNHINNKTIKTSVADPGSLSGSGREQKNPDPDTYILEFIACKLTMLTKESGSGHLNNLEFIACKLTM
jgi:hypothetical protein